MKQRTHKHRSKASTNQTQPRNHGWKKLAIRSGLVVVIAVAAGVFIYSFGGKSARQKTDYATLVGNWVRSDGGYIICIRGVDLDGKLQAGYFNPKPIHVAQATVSSLNNVTKLFMELQDVGYPGSKYNLVYDASEDTLQGTYFQAQDQELYEVVFQRMK